MQHPNAEIIRPPRLEPGDTVGIAAPAGHFDRASLDRGIAVLQGLGFQTVLPDDIFEKKGYFAGSDRKRAQAVNGLFAESRVKAIMCARGGFGSLRALEFLDFQTISRTTKIFIGFSDITVLLSAIYVKCRLTTFHGPTVSLLGNSASETIQSLLTILTGNAPMEISSEYPCVIQSGRAKGPIVGGNLTTLCHLIGTGFFPTLEGKILLLEDRGEAPYRIDRMLTQMSLAGCFRGLAGLVLGSFEACGEIDQVHGIFLDRFKNSGIPVLGGFPVGHGPVNVTVPIGPEAVLDTKRGALLWQSPATADLIRTV